MVALPKMTGDVTHTTKRKEHISVMAITGEQQSKRGIDTRNYVIHYVFLHGRAAGRGGGVEAYLPLRMPPGTRPRDGQGDERPARTAAEVCRRGRAAGRGGGAEACRRGCPPWDGRGGASLQGPRDSRGINAPRG